ncbi:hypothetical protein C8Q73DRAFT_669066 [Cubamyces lactineus]|nr:hypothetical protein C8Q73DRAFT_669066 [Cubamyces lactineus]
MFNELRETSLRRNHSMESVTFALDWFKRFTHIARNTRAILTILHANAWPLLVNRAAYVRQAKREGVGVLAPSDEQRSPNEVSVAANPRADLLVRHGTVDPALIWTSSVDLHGLRLQTEVFEQAYSVLLQRAKLQRGVPPEQQSYGLGPDKTLRPIVQLLDARPAERTASNCTLSRCLMAKHPCMIRVTLLSTAFDARGSPDQPYASSTLNVRGDLLEGRVIEMNADLKGKSSHPAADRLPSCFGFPDGWSQDCVGTTAAHVVTPTAISHESSAGCAAAFERPSLVLSSYRSSVWRIKPSSERRWRRLYSSEQLRWQRTTVELTDGPIASHNAATTHTPRSLLNVHAQERAKLLLPVATYGSVCRRDGDVGGALTAASYRTSTVPTLNIGVFPTHRQSGTEVAAGAHIRKSSFCDARAVSNTFTATIPQTCKSLKANPALRPLPSSQIVVRAYGIPTGCSQLSPLPPGRSLPDGGVPPRPAILPFCADDVREARSASGAVPILNCWAAPWRGESRTFSQRSHISPPLSRAVSFMLAEDYGQWELRHTGRPNPFSEAWSLSRIWAATWEKWRPGIADHDHTSSCSRHGRRLHRVSPPVNVATTI